ncbi:ArpU family phage packaging/lysis transcriptional regulator [Chengkuizengella sediminis]|uniref:ArpU family phage packaging/lysis transcriptional regulator n=1 Tax=Chengkuizengella sediminis TaxID=1885917 RepID=UPI00138A53BD|nr:ArpU family phage packaging/lysis transcriptional regulator [Chengkuizengella sediminis]NDI33618.1 ArpU family transcriptional regulator [Chengkuizengella sediminis]
MAEQQQLNFELPEIDAELTREAVEEVLSNCLLYKTIEYQEKEANLTPAYIFKEHQSTNKKSDSTADIAIENVDEPERRRRYVAWVERAVNRLSAKERQLIIERYLKDQYIYDHHVYYGEMEISPKKYKAIRERAFYKLAFILKVEVRIEKCQ